MLGLVVGILAPGLARAMEPLIFPLIALMLFLATLRVDVVVAFPGARTLPRFLIATLILQVVLPLCAIAGLWVLGAMDSIIGIGAVLVLAAAPLTGSPGLTIMAGGDPAPALRQLVLGTALLPLTVLPVFWVLPVFGAPEVVAMAALRLLAVIAVAGGAGMLLRRAVPWLRAAEGHGAVDGTITLVMSVVVVGLMSAVGPAILAPSTELWLTLAAVFTLNFGAQIGALLLLRNGPEAPAAAALAIVAGNRNLALFLGALPPETGAALLLFIGCYQLPMYLTPLFMAPLIRRLVRHG
ncbi:Predicted Na+-dependent transporter [Roseovarius tolerans]|uniref:Predicted Na+-dependent transporter n=1 Tax=Roseovarius tolerans TaxID=74031 RepID=A0A1H8E150_9RHOB|nr:Predicted Na+-dependent transporter [Roseovarius tolerans]